MSEEARKAISSISDSDWELIIKRLVLYVQLKLKLDNAQQRVEKTIRQFFDEEEDTWDPQNPVVESLTKYLIGIIDRQQTGNNR